ncbi:MAG: glycosyltransferase [Candidatus Aureabacteria bacterium]|nr:glycosyltransferase [Candidatus Auribacterota bacterium]
MKSSPSVSVIIAAYNCALYIPAAIRSVRAQTYRDFEIIVIDDGSTDGTPEAVRQFPGIQYLRQENSGPAAARNRGIASSDADYIAFLDSDDLWKRDKLALQMELLERDPSLAFVYSDVEFFQDDFVFPRKKAKRIVVDPPDAFADLLFSNHIITSSVIAHRSCLKRTGLFDESLRMCEDWDLWLRLARRYPMGHVPRVLTGYRFHGANTIKNARLLYEYEERVLNKFCGVCGTDDSLARYCPMALANLHFLCGNPLGYHGTHRMRTYLALLRLYRKNGALLGSAREAAGYALTLRFAWFPELVRRSKIILRRGRTRAPGIEPDCSASGDRCPR